MTRRLTIAALAILFGVLFHNAMQADKAALCERGEMTLEEC